MLNNAGCFTAAVVLLLRVDVSGSWKKKKSSCLWYSGESNNLDSKIMLASLRFFQEKKQTVKTLVGFSSGYITERFRSWLCTFYCLWFHSEIFIFALKERQRKLGLILFICFAFVFFLFFHVFQLHILGFIKLLRIHCNMVKSSILNILQCWTIKL